MAEPHPANRPIISPPMRRETCHKSTVTFAGARIDHSRIHGALCRCHNGTTHEGKPPRHFLTVFGRDLSSDRDLDTGELSARVATAYGSWAGGRRQRHASNAQAISWKFPGFSRIAPVATWISLDRCRI